jgi:CRISPR/Cas system CSM-associated protein Csm2 small subunit
MKNTSKQEFIAALIAGGSALATGLGKLFLNKIPMGIDRWAEMIAIWATITSLAVAAKTVPRAIATTLSSDFGKLLKEDLNIIVFKNDKNNNKIAATVKTIKIGTLEEFLTKQDDLIYDALKKNVLAKIKDLEQRLIKDDIEGISSNNLDVLRRFWQALVEYKKMHQEEI